MPVEFMMRLHTGRPSPVETRHLHGLACALFEGDVSAHTGQEKPFAVWPLDTDSPSLAGELRWRASWLAACSPPRQLESLTQVRLGAQPLRIARVERQAATHAELVGAPMLRAVTFAFRSPVFFSRNGTDDLSPDPRLILGSYRKRWNGCLGEGHPLAVDDGVWRETHRWVRLTGYDLRTEAMDGGHGRDRAGFVGTATLYVDRGAQRDAVSVFSTLARFAPFCGTGAQTTHGFGATELVGSVLAAEGRGRG
jgi:CRISPR-associated endoribonuclease Cas6